MKIQTIQKWCGRWCAATTAMCFLTGCVEGADAARDRASAEYGCPADRLHVKDIGGSQIGDVYRVAGCGIVATYACNDDGECLKESDTRR